METLREFLGFGVVEFEDFIIKSVFLLFTAIVVAAIVIIRYKEVRHDKKQIRAIIDSVKKVEKVEGILKQYEKTGFKDLEQLAIDVVKICSRKTVVAVNKFAHSKAKRCNQPLQNRKVEHKGHNEGNRAQH